LVFIVNYLVIQIVLKAARQEPLCDLKEKAYVLLLIELALGVVKEAPESRNDVFKEVLNCDVNFDLVRHAVEIEVIIFEKLVSVI